ncbi:MAG: helix-turn-helix domain-containing protein [Eubacteriales bacterium]|nr:helix-turn-helix domain-containing protein [Eubacteriales bacterium]
MYKVILADDNALSIKGLEANLDFASLDAELAGSFLSGMDVVAYLKAHTDIDLLVSDIRMPHMTGLELAREALAIVPGMKIVLISAYDDFEYAQEALRIGVTDYVQKPIQYDLLLAAMGKALRRLEEERSILRRLEEAVPEMRRKFYQDLTRTHPLMAAQLLSAQAQYLEIPVSGGAFLCLSAAWEDARSETVTQARLLRQLSQSDALEKWLSREMDCHLVWEQESLLAVLHAPDCAAEQLPERVRRLCEAFLRQEEEEKSGLCFGIGAASGSLWDVPASMDTALRALNRRFIHPDQSVFTEREEGGGTLPFLTRLTESQSELTQLVLRRDEDALRRMVPLLAASIVGQLRDSGVILPYVMVLASGLLGQIRQDGVELAAAERTLSGFGGRGRHAVSARDIEEFMGAFLRQIMDALAQSQQNCQQKLIARVKAYIDSHLNDSQLRMEAIAEEVHVSPSHLSRIFKRIEDVNVSDYITMKRIDKARHLLTATSDPISLISDEVGYASPYYFSACFKKITGKTPSEYRRGE